LFGSDIWQFIDKPVNIAAANISAEIIDAIGKWEQRIIIKKLTYDINGSRIDFELTAELLESGEVTQILFFIDRQKQIDGTTIGRAFSSGFDFGFS
jgi:phage baseplate assembly protein W